MHSDRHFTSSRSRLRRSTRRRRFTALGWALLLIGLAVVAWRVRIDFGPASRVAAIRLIPAAELHAARPTALPDPSPVPTVSDPEAALAMQGGPHLGASLVDGILAAYQSPLRGQGEQLEALSRLYRVDDAVALAFFVMESRAGTRGEAMLTHNIGNLRPVSGVDAAYSYSTYPRWIDGVEAWFRLVRRVYLDDLKLDTVETVVPIYAPAYDGNDPYSMTANIRQLVRCWRGAAAACPSDPPGIGALVAVAHASLARPRRR